MKTLSVSSHLGVALFSLAMIFSTDYSHAASGSWNVNADGNWATAGSWTPAAVPGSTSADNADVATFSFALTAAHTATVDSPRYIGGISFGNTSIYGYLLSGGLLHLNSGGTIQSLSTDGAHTETISTPLVVDGTTSAAGTLTSGSSTAANGLLSIGNVTGSATASTTTILILNGANTGANTISGVIADGTGGKLSLAKNAAGLWILTGANTYTGSTTNSAGTLQLSGASGVIASTALNSMGGTFTVDNTTAAGGNNNNRIPDTASITGSLIYKGADATSTSSTETVGAISGGAGKAIVTVSYGGANAATLTAASVSHTTGDASILVNGASLGKDSTSTASIGRFISTAAPTLVGATAAATTGIYSSSKNTQIVPFLVGEATSASGGLGTASGTADTFLTYNATTGFRPLNPSDEFTTNAITTGNNTRITTATTASTGGTINSLVIAGNNLTITDGKTLTDTSGALLFTTQNTIAPSSSTGTLDFGAAEAMISVNSGITGTINTPITGSGGLTYTGPGALTLGGANTFTGNIYQRNGSLTFNTAVSCPSGSTIYLGDGGGSVGKTLKFGSTSGYTIPNNITVTDYSITSPYLTFANTSGSDILSGTVNLTQDTFLQEATGGTLVVNNAITGTGGLRACYNTTGFTGTVTLQGGGTFGPAGSYFSSCSGTLNITAPVTVSVPYRVNVGWSFGPGVMNITGTSLTLSANTEVDVGGDYNGAGSGTGTLTIGGTSGSPGLLDLGTTTGSFYVGVASGKTGSGTLNIGNYGKLKTSRTITLRGYSVGNTGAINIDGGTIQLTANQGSLITAPGTSPTTAIINTGGATIDCQTYNGTIGVPLLAGTGTGGLTKLGSGTLTISGANTYAGATTISAGTLALASGASLASGSSISLAAGTTFDVSALGASANYTLGSSASLTASGSASAATIKGGSSGTVSLGTQPITLTYDGLHPALTVSQGTLSLAGNAFTVNTASPLAAGTYTIVQQASGTVSHPGSSGSYTVSGTAIGTGKTASIQFSSGNVNLVIMENTTTALALTTGSSPQTYGSELTFTATLTGNGTTPTGNVVFRDGATTLATVALSSGTAAYTSYTDLGVNGGTAHSIAAYYQGDTTHNISDSSASPISQTITAKALNFSGINTVNKYYDGGMTATFSGTASTLSAEAPGTGSTSDGTPYIGDTVSFTTGTLTGTFTSQNAANNIALTLTGGVTLTVGGQSGNYSVGSPSTALTANITAQPLIITASAQSKPYGTTLSLGTTAFSVGSGLVSPEAVTTVALTASGGTSPTALGGTYTITPSSATGNNGFLAANYNITYATGTLRVNPVPVSSFVLATTKNNAVTFGANKLVLLASDAGVTLSLSAVTTPSAHGTVVLNGDNTITYTPSTDFTGSDSFSYALSDGIGGNATGIVSVTVNDVNAVVLSISMVEGVPTVSTFAIPSYSYNLQYSEDGGSTWNQLTTVTAAANGYITYSDTNYASHNSRIFRLAQ